MGCYVNILPPAAFDVDVRELGILELHLSGLSSALAPYPQHCLSELHSLLPVLGAQAYQKFIARVREMTSGLERPPETAEEFVTHLQLMAQVEKDRPGMDKEYDQVTLAADLAHPTVSACSCMLVKLIYSECIKHSQHQHMAVCLLLHLTHAAEAAGAVA